MSNQEIILFDLPSKPPNKAWSLNPWKTRFVLNFKGIPYKTEWIEYPDLKPKFQDHFPADTEQHTVPTVLLPDGTWIMDSQKITERLEKDYPEPSLHLDSPYLPRLWESQRPLMGALPAVYAPGVFFNVLNEASIPYFRSTREKAFGKTLEKLAEEDGGEASWNAARPYLEKVTALLKENGDGPFFEGKTVGYADFVWAGFLIFMRRIDEDVFQNVLKYSGDSDAHLKLLEGVRPWSERDDY
ncbi:hypothetical protein AAE478_009774 [Parahypoxylon ruwenzoriense]